MTKYHLTNTFRVLGFICETLRKKKKSSISRCLKRLLRCYSPSTTCIPFYFSVVVVLRQRDLEVYCLLLIGIKQRY